MSKVAVNEKNLEALGSKKLSQILMGYAIKDGYIKKDLNLCLAANKGPEDLVKMLTKNLQRLRRGNGKIPSSKKDLFEEEIGQMMNKVQVLIKDHPYAAYSVVWEALILGANIQRRCSSSMDYEQMFKTYFSYFEDHVIQATKQLSPNPEDVVRQIDCYVMEKEKVINDDFIKTLLNSLDEECFEYLQTHIKKTVFPIKNHEFDDYDNKEWQKERRMQQMYIRLCVCCKDSSGLKSFLSEDIELSFDIQMAIARFFIHDVQEPKTALALLHEANERYLYQRGIIRDLCIQAYENLGDTKNLKEQLWLQFCNSELDPAIFDRYLEMIKNPKAKNLAIHRATEMALKPYEYDKTEVLIFLVHCKQMEAASKYILKIPLSRHNTKHMFKSIHAPLLTSMASEFCKHSYYEEAGMVYCLHAQMLLANKVSQSFDEPTELLTRAHSLIPKTVARYRNKYNRFVNGLAWYSPAFLEHFRDS